MKKILILLILLFVILIGCSKDECKGNDSCYFNKASSLGDESHCSKIKNPAIKKSCIVNIAIQRNDTELCNSVDSGYCIDVIAEKLQNPDICGIINDKDWHDTCQFNFALNTSNTTLCRNILSDTKRDECFMQMAKQLNQTTICFNIIARQERDYCIARRAISQTNSNDCYEINDPMIKALCYYKIAIYSGKEKICDSILIKDIRKDCHLAFKK